MYNIYTYYLDIFGSFCSLTWGFPGGSDGIESTCNTKDLGLISGLGRSPGGGHGNPPQYFAWKVPMDRVAQWVTVHGAAKNQT